MLQGLQWLQGLQSRGFQGLSGASILQEGLKVSGLVLLSFVFSVGGGSFVFQVFNGQGFFRVFVSRLHGLSDSDYRVWRAG